MKERASIIILVLGLLILGILFTYVPSLITKFTFSSSELTFSNNTIIEKLVYKPFFKGYHTLYRNFFTPIAPRDVSQYAEEDAILDNDYIAITSTGCSDGTAYFRDHSNRFYSQSISSLAYTEKNEYGCSFGDNLGFKTGKKYIISAEYVLHPKILFEYDGKKYIKFVAYSKKNHPLLVRETNLQLGAGIISKKVYFTSEDVIVYVPYDPENIYNYDVKHIDKLSYDSKPISLINILMIIILPILCFFVWLRYGKETVEGDYPEELSQYPKERKAWEVAAYFHPPFGQTNEKFLPTVIMEFYNRKIIDIADIDKRSHIKIIQESPQLDDVEQKVMDFLKKARAQAPANNGYFSLEKINEDPLKAKILSIEYQEIEEAVISKTNEYIDKKGILILIIAMIIPVIIFLKIYDNNGENTLYWIIFYVISIIIIMTTALRTALFARFKKEYYLEYQQWQGFKNYLSTLYSMKSSPPQGVILWEKYLVYASALGIGKKVLDTLKKWKLINDRQYNSYQSIHHYSALPMFNPGSGSRSGGSGGGGMGGGGMGGGGGGGR